MITAAATLTATAGLLVSPVATSSADAAVCSFTVVKASAPVRENPSSASVIRTTKTVFETVTGPCSSPVVQDPHNADQYFRAVYSNACNDGGCWMATQTIEPI